VKDATLRIRKCTDRIARYTPEGKKAFLADEMTQDAPKPPDTNLTAKTCAGKRGNNVYLHGGQNYIVIHQNSDDMAQKIELGLYLEGDDARRFEEYMADPDRHDTPEGREMTRWVHAHGEELVRSVR